MNEKLESKIEPNNMDGLVWILDGRVHIKNELPGGMPPLINPCDEVKLIINGEQYNHLISVTENDIIELIPLESEKETYINIEITAKELQAYINYIPGVKHKSIVVDTYPINKLDINSTQIVSEEIMVSKERLLEELKKYNVTCGIINNTLNEIYTTNKAGRYLVAQATLPIEPVDEQIEFLFDDSHQAEITLEEDSTGNIDYKNAFKYSAVQTGQMIAKIHNSRPGSEGRTVCGNLIPVREPYELTIIPNSSIYIDTSPGIIRAKKSGRPSKTIKGSTIIINIHNKIVVNEVSIKTGNVRFKGDVEINGNVHESMEVMAKENIYIKGSVSFASILSGNSITIRQGIISSKLNAGMMQMSFKDPTLEINKVRAEIENLVQNLLTLSQREIKKYELDSIQSKIRFLLNNKNRNLPSVIYEVISKLKNETYDLDEAVLMSFVHEMKIFLGDYSRISSVEYLKGMTKILKDMFDTENQFKPASGNVSAGFLLNSEVSALGDVIISGRGVTNSKIFSKGKVMISGSVRGGEIKADKGIDVYMAGSERGGVYTLFSVPDSGYIRAKIVYTDTVFKIGGIPYKFFNDHRMVSARVVNGKIELK